LPSTVSSVTWPGGYIITEEQEQKLIAGAMLVVWFMVLAISSASAKYDPDGIGSFVFLALAGFGAFYIGNRARTDTRTVEGPLGEMWTKEYPSRKHLEGTPSHAPTVWAQRQLMGRAMRAAAGQSRAKNKT
jgi:hypothetical protein